MLWIIISSVSSTAIVVGVNLFKVEWRVEVDGDGDDDYINPTLRQVLRTRPCDLINTQYQKAGDTSTNDQKETREKVHIYL